MKVLGAGSECENIFAILKTIDQPHALHCISIHFFFFFSA